MRMLFCLILGIIFTARAEEESDGAFGPGDNDNASPGKGSLHLETSLGP